MSDANYGPWPALGRKVELRLRRAAWIEATPWYGAQYKPEDLKRIRVLRFWFPFLTWRFWKVHGYAGWKPIYVSRVGDEGGDFRFYWWRTAALRPGELAVQLSLRGGTGDIS